ncbi:ABC transporter permease [Actinomadura atramentaria]|uniref:ABC transporter permease n=1 Tax=Actinomadura atramentaria TaxID=1990 RepID=UPI000365F708|nr:ABC transporter permease [Actinomadura atramentaria]
MTRPPGNRRAVAGAVLLAALFAVAFLGPLAAPWRWDQTDFTAFRAPPSAGHWFGTTQSGRDLFALTLRGMRKSLLIGLLVAVLSTGVAAAVGMTAGVLGGWVDRLLMFGVDLLLVLPSFLAVAVLSPALGGGTGVVLVIAAFLWMITARMVRAMTLSLKERDYVRAARFLGVGPVRVIVRHILPHLASLLVVDAALNVSLAIITEAGLAYLGFGAQPPDASLGTLIADARGAAPAYPWLFASAAGPLVLIVLAVNLLGDGLRDALDPSVPRCAGRAPRRGPRDGVPQALCAVRAPAARAPGKREDAA